MNNPNPLKVAELAALLKELEIHEADLEEEFIRGSGAGGQKINKTSICVRLRHVPTGIEVRCQASRSQAMNRFLARRALYEKIATQVHKQKTAARMQQEKVKRQKRRRSRKAKEKILKDKKVTSRTKKLRERPRE